MSAELFIAVQNKNETEIRRIIKQGTDLSERNAHDKTALEVAAEAEYWKGVRVILNEVRNKGQSIDNPIRSTGLEKVLIIALQKKKFGILTRILQEKINMPWQDPKTGNSILHVMVDVDAPKEVIRLLLECGADLTIQNNAGMTPIAYAVSKKKWTYFDMFLKTIFDRPLKAIVGSVDSANDSVSPAGFEMALLLALEKREFSIVRLLLEKIFLKQKFNMGCVFPETGNSILHVAVDVGAPDDVFSLLLEKGADLNIQNKDKMTPIEYAVDKKEWTSVHTIARVIESMHKLGAKIIPIIPKSYLGIREKNLNEFTKLLEECLVKPSPLSAFVDLIGYAAKANYWDPIANMIKGASSVYNFGRVLLYALKAGKFTIVRLLLQQKIDVSCVDPETGDTVLHMAVKNEAPVSMILLLLKYGASPNKKNKEGQSAWDLVAKFPLKNNLVVAHDQFAQFKMIQDLPKTDQSYLNRLPEPIFDRVSSYVLGQESKMFQEVTCFKDGFKDAIASCKNDTEKSPHIHTFVKNYCETVFDINSVLIVLNDMQELYPEKTTVSQEHDPTQRRANLINELTNRLIENGFVSSIAYYVCGMLEPINKQYLEQAKALNEEHGGKALTQEQLRNLEEKLGNEEKKEEIVFNENLPPQIDLEIETFNKDIISCKTDDKEKSTYIHKFMENAFDRLERIDAILKALSGMRELYPKITDFVSIFNTLNFMEGDRIQLRKKVISELTSIKASLTLEERISNENTSYFGPG